MDEDSWTQLVVAEYMPRYRAHFKIGNLVVAEFLQYDHGCFINTLGQYKTTQVKSLDEAETYVRNLLQSSLIPLYIQKG